LVDGGGALVWAWAGAVVALGWDVAADVPLCWDGAEGVVCACERLSGAVVVLDEFDG